IPRYSMAHDPWAAWGAGTNPEWWQSYNRVKHHRRDYYHEATLSNAILSVSGLFALLLYFYKVKFPGQHVIDPAPRLLVPKYYDPSGWTPASIQWDYGVPDEI